MKTEPWFIQIYTSTSAEAQSQVARLLRTSGRLIVQTEQTSGRHFVIIESDNQLTARTVHTLVTAIDPWAELIGTHDSSPTPVLPVAS